MDQFNKCARTYPHPSEIEGKRELMQIAEEKKCASHTHTVIVYLLAKHILPRRASPQRKGFSR